MARKNKKRTSANVKQRAGQPAPSQSVKKEAPPSPSAPSSIAGPLLLTIADVCLLLNVSRSTIDRLDKSGKLPGRVKLGGQVRYHKQILEQWLKQQIEPSP